MTREQATAHAAERQQRDPTGKWVAVERDGQWIVARIAIGVDPARVSGTAVPPSHPGLHDRPYPEVERIARQYG